MFPNAPVFKATENLFQKSYMFLYYMRYTWQNTHIVNVKKETSSGVIFLGI